MDKKRLGIIIGSIVISAGCLLGGYAYHSAQIAKAQEACVAQVNSLVAMKDYRDAEQKQVQAVMDKYDKQIESTKDTDEMSAFVEQAKGEISEIKTDAEITAEVQAQGIKKLNSIVDLDKYREAQRTEIEDILEKATADIKKLKTTDDVEKIIENAKKDISGYKTDEELTAIEAAAARAAKAKAKSSKKKKKKKKKKNGSKGCVGDDASNFY